MKIDNFFQAGGAVKSTAPCYISRACDDDVLNAILSHRYVAVLGPRQVGKTSLLFKMQANLERRAIPCAIVDLSTLEGADTVSNSADNNDSREIAASWYNQLAAQLHTQLHPHLPGVHKYQDKQVCDMSSFISFLNSLEVVSRPEMRSVIMLDEAAAVPPRLKTQFFMKLRTLLNDRSSLKAEPATRFDFVFAGAFYPGALVTDTRVSPFNVSHEVNIPDFQRPEVDKLLQGFAQLHIQIEADAADELWEATEGHPFLTQKICHSLVYNSSPVIKRDDVKVVVDNILNHDAHLQNLVRRLDENPAEVELIRRVVVRRERIRLNRIVNPAAAQLEMVGALTVGPDGFAKVRNGIYGRLLRAYFVDRS